VLYQGQTSIVPVECVYGIVEVKSKLSKSELIDAMGKIEPFKRLAPLDPSVVRTREYVTVERRSRPCGIAFRFALDRNSLGSLAENYTAEHARIHDVNYYTNLGVVLGEGLIHYEKADLDVGEKSLLLDTDELVDLILLIQKRVRNREPGPEIILRVNQDKAGELTFGRFFVYLLIMLSRMKVAVPDFGLYLDPKSSPMIVRES
jgi:hypothetical protein